MLRENKRGNVLLALHIQYIHRTTPQFLEVQKVHVNLMEILVMDRAFIFRSCVTDRQYSGNFLHSIYPGSSDPFYIVTI